MKLDDLRKKTKKELDEIMQKCDDMTMVYKVVRVRDERRQMKLDLYDDTYTLSPDIEAYKDHLNEFRAQAGVLADQIACAASFYDLMKYSARLADLAETACMFETFIEEKRDLLLKYHRIIEKAGLL